MSLRPSRADTHALAPFPTPEIIDLPHGPTLVHWRRSTRARRVTLRIDPRTSSVIITLPHRALRAAGLELLHGHERWVAERLTSLPTAPRMAPGQFLPLNGSLHLICHRPDARRGVWLEEGRINISGEETFLARRLTEFLKREARNILNSRVQSIAASCGLKPRYLSIRDTKSRWGSCSEKGDIMLSWRLIMAPPEIQHYVVAHELAHLKHFNHSPEFWAVVDQLCTNRKQAEQWLRKQGMVLMRVG